MDHAIAVFGFAPEAINIFDVGSGAAERKFEESLSFGGLEEDAFFLRKTMADSATAYFRPSGQSTAQFFYIVFVDTKHLDCEL